MKYQRSAGVTAEMAGDQVVLLDGAGTQLLTLNVVGTMVWDRLGEPAGVDDLTQSVAAEFSDVPADVVGGDIESFLAELVDLELVDVCR